MGQRGPAPLSQGSRGVGAQGRGISEVEGETPLLQTGAGTLPRGRRRWESLIATCSHAAPRSSLPPSPLPKDPPVNCYCLPVQGGRSAFGVFLYFLFAWVMSPLQKGLRGRGGWEFWCRCLAKRGESCCLKRSR